MVYTQSRIRPREWDPQNSQEFWDTSRSPNWRPDLVSINKKKEEKESKRRKRKRKKKTEKGRKEKKKKKKEEEQKERTFVLWILPFQQTTGRK